MKENKKNKNSRNRSFYKSRYSDSCNIKFSFTPDSDYYKGINRDLKLYLDSESINLDTAKELFLKLVGYRKDFKLLLSREQETDKKEKHFVFIKNDSRIHDISYWEKQKKIISESFFNSTWNTGYIYYFENKKSKEEHHIDFFKRINKEFKKAIDRIRKRSEEYFAIRLPYFKHNIIGYNYIIIEFCNYENPLKFKYKYEVGRFDYSIDECNNIRSLYNSLKHGFLREVSWDLLLWLWKFNWKFTIGSNRFFEDYRKKVKFTKKYKKVDYFDEDSFILFISVEYDFSKEIASKLWNLDNFTIYWEKDNNKWRIREY